MCETTGTNIDEKHLSHLRLADEIVAISEDAEGVEQMIE